LLFSGTANRVGRGLKSAQELEAAKGGVVVARMEMRTIPPPIVAPAPAPPLPFASQTPAPSALNLGKLTHELREEARSRTIRPKPEGSR